MPDPTADFSALADQVKTLTDQFASLQLGQKKLAGDLSIRFEQLSHRINENVTRKVSLPFTPTLDGDWVAGTTSPPAMQAIPGEDVAFGSMPVQLPHLCRVVMLHCEYETQDEGDNQLSWRVLVILERQRKLPPETDPSTLFTDPKDVGSGVVTTFGGFFLGALPNPGMELVDNDLFEYSINASFTLGEERPSDEGVLPTYSVPEGFIVMNSFRVDCIVG